jgi:hypothetical protein
VIPFFSDLLSISSALFISGFSFYFPSLMWFLLIRKGSWTEPRNLILTIVNTFIGLIGLIILVAGTYSSIDDIVSHASIRNQKQIINRCVHRSSTTGPAP